MVPSIAYYISHEPLDSLDIFKLSKSILLNISSLVHQHVYNTNKKLCSKYLIHNLTPSHRAKTTPCVSRSFQVAESCKCFPICPVFPFPLCCTYLHQLITNLFASVSLAYTLPRPLLPSYPTPRTRVASNLAKKFPFSVHSAHTPLKFHVLRRAHQLAPSGTQIAYDAHIAAGKARSYQPPNQKLKLNFQLIRYIRRLHTRTSHRPAPGLGVGKLPVPKSLSLRCPCADDPPPTINRPGLSARCKIPSMAAVRPRQCMTKDVHNFQTFSFSQNPSSASPAKSSDFLSGSSSGSNETTRKR